MKTPNTVTLTRQALSSLDFLARIFWELAKMRMSQHTAINATARRVFSEVDVFGGADPIPFPPRPTLSEELPDEWFYDRDGRMAG